MAVYDDVAKAGENVFRVMENGVIPDKIELLDNWVINRIEEMMPMGLPRMPMQFFSLKWMVSPRQWKKKRKRS